MIINKESLEQLGFTPYSKNSFEYVHFNEEFVYNIKDKSVYEFCEVDGVGEKLTTITKVDKLEEFLNIYYAM